MTPHRSIHRISAVLTALGAVAAIGACGPGPAAVTPPAAPAGLSAAPTSAQSITVTWSAVNGATGYTLERRSGTAPYVPVDPPPGTATTYTDRAVSASTTYTYRVSVTTAAGTSPYSSEASATTPAPTPAVDSVNVVNGILGTPERVTVSGTASAHSGTLQSVSVDWGETGSPVSTVTAAPTSFSVTHDYGASGTYTVKVTATDSAGRTATTARTLDVTRFQTDSQLHAVFDGAATPRDLSGNSRTGVYTGSGCYAAVADRYGVANQAERFNDAGAAACTVSVAGGANTRAVPLPGNFTVDVWIRPDSARVTRGGWLAGTQGGAFSLILGTDGHVTAHLASPGGGAALDVTDQAAVPGNVWTQYVARFEVSGTPAQSTLRLYRKDSPADQTTPARVVGTASAAGSYALPSALPWTVAEAQGGAAASAGDRPFSGDVDDLRLYSRALADYEISALSRLDRFPKPAP